MPSREEITQNLETLHAEQNQRARWIWAALSILAIVVVVVAYRTLGWVVLQVGQQ